MEDGTFFSHLMLWAIGALTAIGGVLTVGAMFTMGRSAYRKD